jgi:hypothetical protein
MQLGLVGSRAVICVIISWVKETYFDCLSCQSTFKKMIIKGKMLCAPFDIHKSNLVVPK